MAELIVAMDVDDFYKADQLAQNLEKTVSWLKVGLELFISSGPAIVERLKDRGFNIFLDLKLYDIPHTVEKAVLAALRLEVDMITVHCQGGERMCRGAREAVEKACAPCLLFGVTVLTSFDKGEIPFMDIEPGVAAVKFASLADAWGLNGVVCSGWEVSAMKRASPNILCLCPGIRLTENADDQRRVMNPQQAVAAGADFLVVGRPIYEAQDPAAAARKYLDNMKIS